MSRLEGKIAVITGGGSGIGLETARRFIAEGAFVYLFGRRQEVLDTAVAELGANNVRTVQGDITKPGDLDRLYERVKTDVGRIDILFANAGLATIAPLGEITDADLDLIIDVNVKGTLLTVQKALPLLVSGSSVILTGSTVGSMGTPGMSVYSASKAAVRNLARSWALDLRGTGIRVNVLSPGPTGTETLHDIATDEMMNWLVSGTPLGRVGAPTETAAVAAFLASDDSSFMTGSEIFADGGFAQV